MTVSSQNKDVDSDSDKEVPAPIVLDVESGEAKTPVVEVTPTDYWLHSFGGGR